MQNKNLSSQKRGTLILIPALAIVLAVSGCGKKETPKPVVNNNTNVRQVNKNTNANENVNANLDQNTNSNVNENQDAGAVEDGQSGERGEEIDTSDWQTYRNEEYGFEVKYPEGWRFMGDQLNSFSTPFKEIGVSLECGIFENSDFKSPKEWVDGRDFFQLKQFENNDTYVAYGISDEIETVKTNNNIELLNYNGGASGGGVFETAIIPFDNKVIVVTYSLAIDFSANIKEQTIEASNIFNQILKSFSFKK